jgi:multiple sugar transport system permease protein
MKLKRPIPSSNPFKPSLLWMAISYILLLFWAFVVLMPLYWLVVTAFKIPADVNNGPTYLPFVDYQPRLDAWHYLLVESGENFVRRPYFNTALVGVSSALYALVIGAAASYALSRFDYRPKVGLIATFAGCVLLAVALVAAGIPWPAAVVVALAVYVLLAQSLGRRFTASLANSDIAFWLISQRMLPPVAVIIPIYVMFQQFSLLNTHAGLIIAYTAANLPLAVWFLRDYFQTIPIDLEESAFIDGANRYQVLFRIILPLAVPGLIATFLIVLVFAWNEYTMALFLTGAETQTMPLLVSAQNATRGPQWWNISVLVVLMIAPITILAVFLERYIARGILVGAVKG